MTTAYTSLLGLALPVTGELSGTWGDTVNNAITSLLDTAVAGTTSITTDADITLTTTTGASNQARQAIILWNPASGTTTRNITAPAQSKIYTVINASGGTQSIVLRGVGPTTGVTIVKGESATVAWNGTDFVKVSTSGGPGTFTNLTVTGNTILGDASADTLTVNATITSNLIFTDNTYDIGASGATRPRTGYFGTSLITPLIDATNVEATNIKALDGTAAMSIANSTGVVSLTANPILSGGTANGVTYLNGSKVLTSGTALVFDGTQLGVGSTPSLWSTFIGLQVGAVGSANIGGFPDNIFFGSNNYFASGQFRYSAAGYPATVYRQVAGAHNWSTTGGTTGSAGDATSSSVQVMVLSSSGNLTVTSLANTDSIATINSTSTNVSQRLNFTANGTIQTQLYDDASQTFLSAVTSKPLAFRTANTEWMRITSAGLVGINSNNPQDTLHVIGRTRLSSTGTVNDHQLNAATALEVRGPAISAGGTTRDYFKGFKIALNDGAEYGGQAQFALGRWEESSTEARSSLVISLGNGAINSQTDADVDVMTLLSNGNVGIGTTAPVSKFDVRAPSSLIANYQPIQTLSTDSAAINTGGGLGLGGFYNSTQVALFGTIVGRKENSTDGNYAGYLAFGTNAQATGILERMRIRSDGRMLVNSTALLDYSTIGYSGTVQIAQSGNAQIACAGFYDSATYGGEIILSKSRSNTIGTNTIVQNNDQLGSIFFAGANGTGYSFAAHIKGVVDGTPGASNDMPGRLVFSTSADGSESPTERMRITSAGTVNIGTGASLSESMLIVRNNATSRNQTYFYGLNSSTYTGYTSNYQVQAEFYQSGANGTTLTIPITNQGSVWVGWEVRVRGVASNYNLTTSLPFSVVCSASTATFAIGFTATSTGNVSSVAMSGTSIVITFTSSYYQINAGSQTGGVCVEIEFISRAPSTAPIEWSNIAMN